MAAWDDPVLSPSLAIASRIRSLYFGPAVAVLALDAAVFGLAAAAFGFVAALGLGSALGFGAAFGFGAVLALGLGEASVFFSASVRCLGRRLFPSDFSPPRVEVASVVARASLAADLQKMLVEKEICKKAGLNHSCTTAMFTTRLTKQSTERLHIQITTNSKDEGKSFCSTKFHFQKKQDKTQKSRTNNLKIKGAGRFSGAEKKKLAGKVHIYPNGEAYALIERNSGK